MKKFIIKYLPLLVLWAVFLSWGLYGTAIRQRALYEEYNGMRGTVTSVVVGSRTAAVFCDIKLDNGTWGSVNNGYTKVSPGDRWVNHITSYSMFFGMSGYAYSIIPEESRCLTESFLVLFLLIVPVTCTILYYIYKFIKMWIVTH